MSGEVPIVQSPGVKKQKHRVLQLQKKLEIVQAEQQKMQSEVEKLIAEISEAQLALIHRKVDEYERKGETGGNLFETEREALYQMIQSGSSPSALEAQVELDRILRLITERSE